MKRVIKLAKRILLAVIITALVLFITGFLWWTGEGYCVGTMAKCVGL